MVTDTALQARVPLTVRYPDLVEILTGVIVALAGIAGSVSYIVGGTPLGLVAMAICLSGAALVWRYPWVALVITALAPLAGALLGVEVTVLWSMSTFVGFGLCFRGLPALPVGAIIGLGSYFAVVTAGQAPYTDDLPGWAESGAGWFESLSILAFVVACAFAFGGAAVRSSQEYWKQVQLRGDDALATREAEAERRVAEERIRIAHDLHDVLGHEIALVSMSLGAAEVHLPPDADAARLDLVRARSQIQSVLSEVQQVLHVLRDAPGDTTPAADYMELDHLVQSFRAAGLDIESEVEPVPPDLNPEVSAAVYRIVQEALTNAGRHGSGPVQLFVVTDDDIIRILVRNRRGTQGPSAGGFGLIGMRERAHSSGGRIDIDQDEDWFALRAALPVRGKEAV